MIKFIQIGEDYINIKNIKSIEYNEYERLTYIYTGERDIITEFNPEEIMVAIAKVNANTDWIVANVNKENK